MQYSYCLVPYTAGGSDAHKRTHRSHRHIWWPNGVPCAYSYNLTAHDIDNMRSEDGKIARREIQEWLDTHAGDFSEILDFTAQIDSASYGWASEESELTYSDCMFESYES